MDRYTKGLITAYTRVLALIETLDPEAQIPELLILRYRIQASLDMYEVLIGKEALQDCQSEYLRKIKALEGTLTQNDIDKIIGELDAKVATCKILTCIPTFDVDSND